MKRIITLLIVLVTISFTSLTVFAVGTGFEKIAENKNLAMYFNEKTCEIAVEDTTTGELFYSNPQDRKEDPVAAGAFVTELASQAIVTLFENKTGNEVVKNSAVGSVNKKTFTVIPIENGIEVNYVFEKEGVAFSIQYILEEDYLKVVIPADKIKENEQYQIKGISVLPYFGAGNKADEGYIFVADGSGALIDFNTQKAYYAPYKAPVYGMDEIYNKSSQNKFQNAYMPVFGINKEEQGYLAVMMQGESLSYINASTGGVNTSYNNGYFSLELRQSDVINVGLKQVNKINQNPISIKEFEIRYYPLEKGKTDYVGMANKYKEVLEIQDKVTNDIENPLYITLYGAVQKREYKLGIPMYITKALTTYEEAIKILEELKAKGVNEIVVNYKYATENEINGKLTDKFIPIKKLGGKKDFNKLMKYCKDNNIQLYVESEFLKFSDEDFLTENMKSSKNLATMAIRKYPTNLVTGKPIPNAKQWRLLSPAYVLDNVTNYINSLNKYEGLGVGISSLGNMMYSDYGDKQIIKESTKRYWMQAIEYIDQKGKSILADSANIYSYNYIKHNINIPMYCSYFDMVDESVPFYQILMSGNISYGTTAINLSENTETAFLNAIESGSMLHYEWIYRDANLLNDTEYESLYSVQYKDWIDDAANKYKEINELHEQIGKSKIVQHGEVVEGVKQTVYESGITTYVNYNETEVDVLGESIPARGYRLQE